MNYLRLVWHNSLCLLWYTFPISHLLQAFFFSFSFFNSAFQTITQKPVPISHCQGGFPFLLQYKQETGLLSSTQTDRYISSTSIKKYWTRYHHSGNAPSRPSLQYFRLRCSIGLCLSKQRWQPKNMQLKDSKLQNRAREAHAIDTAAFISSSSTYWFSGNKAYLHKPRPNLMQEKLKNKTKQTPFWCSLRRFGCKRDCQQYFATRC